MYKVTAERCVILPCLSCTLHNYISEICLPEADGLVVDLTKACLILIYPVTMATFQRPEEEWDASSSSCVSEQ